MLAGGVAGRSRRRWPCGRRAGRPAGGSRSRRAPLDRRALGEWAVARAGGAAARIRGLGSAVLQGGGGRRPGQRQRTPLAKLWAAAATVRRPSAGRGGRQGRGWSGHSGAPVPAEQAMGERPTVGRGAAAVRRAAGGDLAAATVWSADKGRGLAGWGGCGLAERALSWTESNACLGLGPANLVNGLKFGSSGNRNKNRNRTEHFGS